jgi:type 1 glutamine amidotransferase
MAGRSPGPARSARGRVFYTALGHEEAVWRDPRYQRMLTNAIRWTTRRTR